MRRAKKGLTVGVVGATGMVGCELLEQLARRRFPVGELLPFSSGASRKTVRFAGRALNAPGVSMPELERCDVVFFVSSDEVSAALAPRLAARGVWCLDDSAAFRMDPDVPLVIPEVNAGALRADRKLIAGPNCTMTGLAVAGYPLHRALGVRRARIASYQAVSGAGKAALQEFFDQGRALHPLRHDGGPAPVLKAGKSKALPAAIACNVIPQVGRFDEHGHSSEERKVAAELRKIWGAPDMKISVTAVRVPVVRGHSLAAWLEFGKALTPRRARTLLRGAAGLTLSREGSYPTPLSAGGTDPVHAGRLRQGADEKELCLWIVSDNLLKGAALNSIQTAEELLRRRWLAKRAA